LATNITQKLHSELWRRFGTLEHPAEWDGHVYGGGKLSQRYWEYFKAIELLDLHEESVVLDIGGGSPITGAGFFASLLSTAVKEVIIFDSQIAQHAIAPENVRFERHHADFATLLPYLADNPSITHVSCVSVLEHIPAITREGIMGALEQTFVGTTIVVTLEYHARKSFFEHQLTARSLSELFAPVSRFYPDKIESSPIWCENAFNFSLDVPYWYPVAIRFCRMPSAQGPL